MGLGLGLSVGIGIGVSGGGCCPSPQVESIAVRGFAAGDFKLATAEGLVGLVAAKLAQLHPAATITTQAVLESSETAFGSGRQKWGGHNERELPFCVSVGRGAALCPLAGCGVCAVAHTSGGCLLGATAPLRKAGGSEAAAQAIVSELDSVLASGACVDQW